MELTKHGRIRAFERTKLAPSDVAMLIESNTGIFLKGNLRYKYFLFYSFFDKDWKIAIISNDTGSLISVWEKDYFLPEGIEKLNDEMLARAKVLAGEFIKGQPIENKDPCSLEAHIQVMFKGAMEYEHQPIVVEGKDICTPKDLVIKLKIPLEKILKALHKILRKTRFQKSPKLPTFKIKIVDKNKNVFVKSYTLRLQTLRLILQETAQ